MWVLEQQGSRNEIDGHGILELPSYLWRYTSVAHNEKFRRDKYFGGFKDQKSRPLIQFPLARAPRAPRMDGILIKVRLADLSTTKLYWAICQYLHIIDSKYKQCAYVKNKIKTGGGIKLIP
jgi:hypothetical protein